MNIILIILIVVVVSYLSLFIHELGHLVCGFATGYKFNCFQIGPLLWYKDNGCLKFKRLKGFSVSQSGSCLMIPTEKESSFNFFWYSFGGIFFNSITTVILFFIYKNLAGDNLVENILIIGIGVNVFYSMIALIPIPNANNDGYIIYASLKSEEAKRGFYYLLYLEEAMNKGKRFRDFSPNSFIVSATVKLNNQLVIFLILCEAGRLKDRGEHHLAMKELERLDFEKLSTLFKLTVNLELLDYYIIHSPDFKKAKEIYQNQDVQFFLTNDDSPTSIRILSVYTYFVLGNKKEGKVILEKVKEQLKNHHSIGYKNMEFEYVEFLESIM